MRSKSFGPTINSLQRAYSKLLHENFENEWSSEISGNVRDLAAAIVWKLNVKSEEAAEEGRLAQRRVGVGVALAKLAELAEGREERERRVGSWEGDPKPST